MDQLKPIPVEHLPLAEQLVYEFLLERRQPTTASQVLTNFNWSVSKTYSTLKSLVKRDLIRKSHNRTQEGHYYSAVSLDILMASQVGAGRLPLFGKLSALRDVMDHLLYVTPVEFTRLQEVLSYTINWPLVLALKGDEIGPSMPTHEDTRAILIACRSLLDDYSKLITRFLSLPIWDPEEPKTTIGTYSSVRTREMIDLANIFAEKWREGEYTKAGPAIPKKRANQMIKKETTTNG